MYEKLANLPKVLNYSQGKTTFLLICLLILLALPPRLWKLSEYPPIIVDEPAYLRDIGEMIQSNNFYPAIQQWDGSQASLVYYPTIMLVKWAGFTDWLLALRTSAALVSILTIIPFYFLVKRYTNDLVAFCVSFMFSYSYYFLQFSRVGWGVVYATALGLFALWATQEAVRRKSLVWLVVGAFFAGLTSYSYRSGEVYIAACLISIVVPWGNNLKYVKTKVLYALIFILTFFTFFLPWGYTIFSNWDFFTLRGRVVSVINIALPYHGYTNTLDIVIYQIATTIKTWIFLIPADGGGIENSRYLPLRYPPISFPLIPLFITGLIFAIQKWRESVALLFIFFFSLTLGQILTVDPPNGARALGILPIIYICVGISLYYVYKKIEFLKKFPYVIIATSVAIGVTDSLFYIYWMSWIKV